MNPNYGGGKKLKEEKILILFSLFMLYFMTIGESPFQSGAWLANITPLSLGIVSLKLFSQIKV